MSAEQLFSEVYSTKPQVTSQAWGRVNLIGEHIDYNGGMVLPAPIGRFINMAVSPSDTGHDEIYSNIFDGLSKRDVGCPAQGVWSDYVVGALNLAREKGLYEGNVRVAIESDVPYGAGVSSSAAVIVATFRALAKLNGEALDGVQIAKWAQIVENDYIGMPCGIMDQMAVSMAEPGSAIALDTDSLDFSIVDLPKDYHFAVVFSGVTRQLEEGRYAVRRQECEAAAAALGVEYLCQMSDQQIEQIASLEDVLARRARHCVSEHQRVLEAINAIQAGNMARFGQLMNQSHVSMRDDFEITVPEVDALVETSVEKGALGARMTGGGFGGCIVACVAKDNMSDWISAVLAAHPKAELVA